MTPEEHADSVLILLDSDFGQSGRDIRWLAIRDQIRQAQRDAYENAANIILNSSSDFTQFGLAVKIRQEAEKLK